MGRRLSGQGNAQEIGKTLYRLTLSALLITLLALVLMVAEGNAAKPEKPGVRRLTKYTCELNIGQVRECKSKGLNAEVEVKEVTNQSTLIISAEFRNSGPLLCASIGTTLRFDVELIGPGRYSPPNVVAVDRSRVWGNPDPAHISTSYVERQNLTMRMNIRRLTRLTNGFSKKVENLRAAVALHFAYYNFVRYHQSLPSTPAVRAGVTSWPWKISDLLDAVL